jgi:hypothetical protein
MNKDMDNYARSLGYEVVYDRRDEERMKAGIPASDLPIYEKGTLYIWFCKRSVYNTGDHIPHIKMDALYWQARNRDPLTKCMLPIETARGYYDLKEALDNENRTDNEEQPGGN